jgi:predicted N-acetyltransferase YhbS
VPTIVVPEGYLLERLDPARHSRSEFSCGKEALDVFLRTQASQAQGKFASATHVLVEAAAPEDSRHIVGYVTLVTSEIALADVSSFVKKISNKPRLPALLLAKMAVDSAHMGKRLGECLLKHALVTAWRMNQNAGCVVVIVDAKDDEAKQFYLKYGFLAMLDKPLRLILPMGKIEKLFAGAPIDLAASG